MKGRKMKLEHIINVDFANLVHSGSDEYDFDLVQFKNEELVIKSRKNTRELVKELQYVLAENGIKAQIEVNDYVVDKLFTSLIYIK